MDVDNSFRNSTLQFARGRFDQSSFRDWKDSWKTNTEYRIVYACIYLQKVRKSKCNCSYPQSIYTGYCYICNTHIEEAKIVVGNPVIIPNKPSGSTELANIVSEAFGHGGEKIRAVIIRNHGVVAVGYNIHQARAVVEALEEWAKILTISKIFGGPKYVID